MAIEDPLTRQIIGLAMRVHRALGPGFLESVYRRALCSNCAVQFVDILVEDRVLLELKAVEVLHTAHEVQTVNYLTATGIDVGLLLNFGGRRLQVRRKFRHPRAPQTHPALSIGPDNPVNPV
jgi:hypothetical protein